jgi:hypothetical protein
MDRDDARKALEEAVYAVRNAAGVSEWHRRYSSRPFDYEDFCVWVDHWALMHPVVTQIASLHDREVLLRADAQGIETRRAETGDTDSVAKP